ncbi:carbohydrate-binding module family 18 protein [Dothistroma septosporum NZE10]|uniref:Carbohydrate-binding module family 18 protein n=1 Tax=Dothistroma septosporum (strain NZE10 / CBS 128990) TaxID=675120 RepID=M2YIC1_DOTSN|nr:carbohydrate-binding module family 18 protein [Dothistroma septosporum NZE10]
MKKTPLTTLLSVTLSSANIIFPFVQPTCDFASTEQRGCFRGQTCLADNTCTIAPKGLDFAVDDPIFARASPPQAGGRCGKDFHDATCDSDGKYGGCCSGTGWCGKTADHCLTGNGCQNGCTADTPDQTPATITSTKAGPATEPVIGPSTNSAGWQTSGAPTTDGSCGAANGGTVCGNWHLGSCCSAYGFCGNTSNHCGDGCQSGPCDSPPVPPAPSASPAPPSVTSGSFDKTYGDSGVPAMHAALLPNGRVVFLDKVENFSKLRLSNGENAFSAEYDPATGDTVALAYKTNAFCSGGSFLANGTVMSIGGNEPFADNNSVGNGFKGLRWLTRSSIDNSFDGQDWVETDNTLNTARWYASVQTMPDGTLFVVSGSLTGLDPTKNYNNNPTYEILDMDGISRGASIPMEILIKAQPYYMYPFMHLLNDGTVFVFVSKSSEIFDVAANETVKKFDGLPGDYRTYPNTGGSVLLPLSSSGDWKADIIICGGGVWQGIDSPTDPSCGRIQPQSDDPSWEMDSMPEGRGMVEGILLPDGTVLWVNGASRGAQGYLLAEDPTTTALLYDHNANLGQRWHTDATSEIPRLYHSVALLMLDGTVMIAGSNPVQMPMMQKDATDQNFTEYRVETYIPPYLSGSNADRRPTDITLSSLDLAADASTFEISFTAPQDAKEAKVSLYHGGFVTHSLHMSHRMLFLDTERFQEGQAEQNIQVTMPPNNKVAPPGPYVVYVVVDGVPGLGQVVMVA